MGAFKKYNGKEGYNAIYHTSTGYKCLARVENPADAEKEIYFYAKHVVGADGRPYTEFGFESNEEFSRFDLIDKVKQQISDYGFKEVLSIGNTETDGLSFAEHSNPIPNVVEFRACAGKYGVMKVFEAMEWFVEQDCIDFVVVQEEEVEETLYLSILDSMGDSMKRGPGGMVAADAKARELANMFIHGMIN